MHPHQVLKGNTCRYFVGWVEFSTASQRQKKICRMSKLFSCIICLSVEYEIYHDSTFFFFFFNNFVYKTITYTVLTALITLTLYLLLTLLILILTQIMHTLHYDTCITILLTLI